MTTRKKPAKKKGGRPQVDLNWKQLDALLGIQCTRREAASVMGCSEDTVERAIKREHGQTFREYADLKRGPGVANLRRRQYEVAIKGDRTMLVWLGKQWLGQTDKQFVEHAVGRDQVLSLVRAMGDVVLSVVTDPAQLARISAGWQALTQPNADDDGRPALPPASS